MAFLFRINHISQTIKQKLKKIGVEMGLLGIKYTRLTARLFIGFFHIVGNFSYFLFKKTIYQILAEIYFGFFRFKKTILPNQRANKLTHGNLIYLAIFFLVTLLVFSNLLHKNKANALEARISKTIMANLVQSEFSSAPAEELIEETASPLRLTTDIKETYPDEYYTLDKQDSAIDVDNAEYENLLSFNNEGDLIYKPRTSSPENDFIPQRSEIVYYTVQSGDTVSSIAQKFGITINTILWANNLTAYSLIRPGNTLTILPYSGILYTAKSGDTVSKIAKTYGVEEEKILGANNLSAGLKVGQKIMVPGARKISTAVAVAKPTSNYTGITAIKNLIAPSSAKSSSGSMIWPTPGRRITQYYSWSHQGLDIGDKIGTPLYAADDGVVIIAQGGWNGGYGNTILLDHGGGKRTRYGHASKLFVKVGDEVKKGETIAAMGSTGRSTGPHLHFEVLVNGTRYNPLNYIK